MSESPVGNVVAHIGGRGPKILLDAHSDEIGYVVRSIMADGFIQITTAQRLAQPRFGVYLQFGNNASRFIAAGIPSMMISPPTRYTHSPFEVVHEDDVENAICLLVAHLTAGA